jgi:hypothetical protein
MSEDTFTQIRALLRASDDVRSRAALLLRRLDRTITESRELLERLQAAKHPRGLGGCSRGQARSLPRGSSEPLSDCS